MFEFLQHYKTPVLLWSAGNDSTLLLAMLIEANIPVDIVQFGREFWTKEQKRRADELIMKWNLKVLSYPPIRTSFIGNDDQISLVREYAFMGAVVPMVSDLIEGQTCIADLDSHKAYAPPVRWDLVLVGSRKDDSHYAMTNVIPSKHWTAGDTDLYAALYDWTREEVIEELKRRDLPYDEVDEQTDSGNISLCSKCLQGIETLCPKENAVIPPVIWNRHTNLTAFQAAYN